MKRLFDILFSFIVLVAFFPLGIAIIIVLSFTGESKIFYIQQRIGKNLEPFGLLKFASMLKDSPNIGAGNITLKNDPRVLPFGKFLRKTKLNEFPQFVNVFLGDMSVVGPRPLVKNQFNMIPDELKEKIQNLKPGITGVGSIVFRNEEQYLNANKDSVNEFYKTEIVPYKAKLECWYYDNRSIMIDILLIVLTALLVIFPDFQLHNVIFSDLPRHRTFNS